MTPTTPTPATDFVEALAAEPRPKAVAAFDGEGRLLLRADAPDGFGSLVPTLVGYRRGPAGTWAADWSVTEPGETIAVPGGFLYVRRRAVTFRSAHDGADVVERVVEHVAGEIATLALRPGTATVACVIRTAGPLGAHPEGLLQGSDAVWSQGAEASLAAVRRPEGDWQIRLVDVGTTDAAGRDLPVTVPDGASLTGEAAWSGPDTLLLGLAHHRPDGTRRFGLLAVRAEDGATERSLLFDGIDLCYPVADPDGGQVAYLGTSVPANDAPPVQSACLVRPGTLELAVLDAPAGTWQRPVGWHGPGRLVCTAEDGPRRRLYVYEPARDSWRDVPLAASAESVQVRGGRVAVLVSALDTPPAVDVVTLADGHTERVEASERPPLPGTLSYHRQAVPGATGALASWLCRPAEGPVRGLVVFFHGGPFKSWTEWSWRWNPWPFVASGYAVALIEPPMSLGYVSAVPGGWANWRSGIAAVAVRQVEQLRAETGLAELPLALMGGSFGGYLSLSTAAALRPRLIASHAAPLDLVQVAESSDVGWQWLREYGEPASAQHAGYRDNSLPVRPVPEGTRVLLSHGMHDGLVPPTETLRVHRQLSRQGVRSEVAFFRSEAHPLSRPRNIRAWYRWVLTACASALAGEAGSEIADELTGELAARFAELAMGGLDDAA
ncbi:S9 family peptidase [Streptomyces sp. NBC_00272]|uniref:S9 family peptidase n=1 Tax=Streptomyces sp. NBC_00272 TaxID=2975698 RepID=UPI002E2BB151|nr:prolyl oligopeptidase family serine peptidase [Streptomyces sp. NBC_00272]